MSIQDWQDDTAIAAEVCALQAELARLNRIRDAAPELLEACETAFDDIDAEAMPETARILRAAIAKARGDA